MLKAVENAPWGRPGGGARRHTPPSSARLPAGTNPTSPTPAAPPTNPIHPKKNRLGTYPHHRDHPKKHRLRDVRPQRPQPPRQQVPRKPGEEPRGDGGGFEALGGQA